MKTTNNTTRYPATVLTPAGENMTASNCGWHGKRLPRQSRMAAVACMALLGAATASGQLFDEVPGLANWALVACAGSSQGVCYPESIAVGPQSGVTEYIQGDPWVLGNTLTADGNFDIYQLQGSTWVKQPGAATQIAISPNGYPWVINQLGQIFYWNGKTFELAPGNGCATSIGVGPNAFGSTYGDPWVIGCEGGYQTNGSIFQLQGSTWVKQPGAATQIAVSPEGVPWVINAAGSIFYWNGSPLLAGKNFVEVPGCATSIAVGPNTDPGAGPYGDVWVTGCNLLISGGSAEPGGGYGIFQFQNGTSWVEAGYYILGLDGPGGFVPYAGTQISLSPDLGNPWFVNDLGQIYADSIPPPPPPIKYSGARRRLAAVLRL
jgi:hypothetical protein